MGRPNSVDGLHAHRTNGRNHSFGCVARALAERPDVVSNLCVDHIFVVSGTR